MRYSQNRKRLALAGAVLAAAGLLGGCAHSRSVVSGGSSVPGETAGGTVGVCKAAGSLALYEYEEYLPAGYSAQRKEYADPAAPLAALLAGELDFCEAPLSAVIEARSEGKPVAVLCNLTGRDIAVVTGAGTGGAASETAAALQGKRVGYTPDTTGYTLLLLALKEAGIEAASVKWEALAPREMNAALREGRIDAYCADAEEAGEAILGGYGRVLLYPYRENTLGTVNRVLVTTEAVIAAKRDWLQQMVDAHRQAAENLRENREALLEAAAVQGFSGAALTAEEDNLEMLWDIEEEFVISTRNLAAQMLDAGLIAAMPDMAAIFDHTFLEKTKQHFLS